MTNITSFLAATAAIGSLAAPAAAQYYPQQPTYPQQQYQQTYPQQGYAYGQQGYAQGNSQNPFQQIIDSLLGNRYNVTDRQAISQCATAAVTQAQAQYGNRNGQAYAQGYGQQNGYAYNRMAGLRVTAITDVQRRSNGLRVSGTMGSGGGYASQYGNGAYGNQYANQNGYQNGYQNQGYGAAQLSFRCNVDYRGAVTGVRVRPIDAYRG